MAKLHTNNLQVATLQRPEPQKPLCPISVPSYGETAAAVDAIYGAYIRRFDPARPEEQFQVDVMFLSHLAIGRLASREPGLFEATALNPGAHFGNLFALYRSASRALRAFNKAWSALEALRAARSANFPTEPNSGQPS
jgi:hypothetical protein